MKFLYVIDPIAALHPASDTSLAFMRASQAAGVDNYWCELHHLSAHNGGAIAHCKRVRTHVPSAAEAHFSDEDAGPISLSEFRVVWMRKDPPVDDLYLFACMLLERVDPARTLVLNDPRNLRTVHEKLWTLAYPQLIPSQVVSSSPVVLRAFLEEHGGGVVKPLAFMGGFGVMVFGPQDRNIGSALDLLTSEGKRPVIAQELLKAIDTTGDKRVLLLDGEPIGALARLPASNDVRANLRAGGSAHPTTIDDQDRNIARTIGPELKRLGMFFVGLDVIGGKLTEVNVTSPTGVMAVNRLDNRNGDDRIENIVMRAVLKKVGA
jgi:glutathione synthase